MKDFLRRNWILFFGLLAGAVAGLLYYHYIGCVSGSCPITSQPIPSALYGALLGGLIVNTIRDRKRDSAN